MKLKPGDLIRFKEPATVPGADGSRVVALYSETRAVYGRSYPANTLFIYLDMDDSQLKTRIYVISPDSTELHCRVIVNGLNSLNDYIEVMTPTNDSKCSTLRGDEG